jgi:hypothetical protein
MIQNPSEPLLWQSRHDIMCDDTFTNGETDE